MIQVSSNSAKLATYIFYRDTSQNIRELHTACNHIKNNLQFGHLHRLHDKPQTGEMNASIHEGSGAIEFTRL